MKKFQFFIITLLTLALSACGGGSSSSTSVPPTTPSTAEGLWKGTTGNGRTIAGIVLDNGTFWFLYSKSGNANVLGGAVQGASTSNNGSFSSTDAKDFNLEGLGVLNPTISASYVAKQSLNGSLNYSGVTNAFTSTYDNAYDQTTSLTSIAGFYSGLAYGVGSAETATLTISVSGSITGTSQTGCTYSGTAVPHTKGNVFDISIIFGGSPCANGTNQVNGIVYFDNVTKVLYALGLNNSRTNGFIFSATKQ